MPLPTPAPPLAEGYYLRNLERLLETVVERYGDLLRPVERALYVELGALTLPARRLYARLLSRSGREVRVDALRYPEIANDPQVMAAVVDELVATGFADRGALGREASPTAASLPPRGSWRSRRRDEHRPPDDPLAARSRLLRRAELLVCWSELGLGVGRGLAARRRDDLLAELASRALGDVVLTANLGAWLHQHLPVVRALRRDEMAIFQLCFFGNLRQDLADFVLAELGVVRYCTPQLDPHWRLFPSRAALDDVLAFRRLADAAHTWQQAGEHDLVLAAARELLSRGAGWHPLATRYADRLLLAGGRILERSGELAEAVELYAAATAPPARERQARVRLELGELARAAELVAAMAAAPRDEIEVVMAERLGARLEKLVSRNAAALATAAPSVAFAGRRSKPAGPKVSERPLSSRRRVDGWDELDLVLDRPPGAAAPGRVERLALTSLTNREGEGFFAENWLWMALFGLAFWDVVFAAVPGAFHHPFQYGPLDLEEPEFRVRRSGLVADRLAQLAAATGRGELSTELLGCWENRRGLANRLVPWDDSVRPKLALALSRLTGTELAAVADRLAHNLGRFGRGLPDLFVGVEQGERGFALYEVKAPGDSVRPEQRTWLRYLAAQDIDVRVVRVRWSAAPVADAVPTDTSVQLDAPAGSTATRNGS